MRSSATSVQEPTTAAEGTTSKATPASAASSSRRERSKSGNTVAARMKQVVDKLIQAERAGEAHTELTLFLYRNPQSEITNAFFQEFQRENGAVFRDRDQFLALLGGRYDAFRHALST